MRGSRRDYHQSSFTFESFHEHRDDPQKEKIYSYPSCHIQEAMQAEPPPPPTRTQLYQHQIFHSTHKYEVPLDPAVKPTQDVPAYHQFYRTFRKFTKPYGELTKFTDSLKQNQALLRRSQYDTPIHFNHPCLSEHVFRPSRALRSQKMGRKEGRSQTRAMDEKEDQQPFHKTIQNHFVAFNKLMTKERQSKNDITQLNNSLNRLLAAQTIREQLKGRVRLRSKTQNR